MEWVDAFGHTDRTPLAAKLIADIKASPRGAIPFREYMEACLYDPEYGYYMQPVVKVGKEGDFYTSSHVGTVMADILVRYVGQVLGQDRQMLRIEEWGGGSGRLAAQLMERLEARFPDELGRIRLVMAERSGYHRRLQQEALGQVRMEVRFIDPGEPEPIPEGERCLILANELLDAFPVHRVKQAPEGLLECHVGWDQENKRFREEWFPCERGELQAYLDAGSIRLARGQIADINLEAPRWIERQLERFTKGVILAIDYGGTADDLYGPHRMAGTLMCYYRHRAHADPYVLPGEQDITSHVDFSACIRAGIRSGATAWTLRTQKQFLVDFGALELLREPDSTDPFGAIARQNRALRQLLLMEGLAETFKVLELVKA